MIKAQKGQDVIEFALVLPFLLLLVFGITYFGFLFTDYLSISNVARSSAREASIQAMGHYDNGVDAVTADYDTVRNRYLAKLKNGPSLYVVNDSDFTIEPTLDERGKVQDVKVSIVANLDTSKGITSVFGSFLPKTVRTFTVEYRMYQDRTSNNDS